MGYGIKHLQRVMTVTEAVAPFLGKQSCLGRGKMLGLEVWGKTDRDLEMFSQEPHGSCLSVNE